MISEGQIYQAYVLIPKCPNQSKKINAFNF